MILPPGISVNYPTLSPRKKQRQPYALYTVAFTERKSYIFKFQIAAAFYVHLRMRKDFRRHTYMAYFEATTCSIASLPVPPAPLKLRHYGALMCYYYYYYYYY